MEKVDRRKNNVHRRHLYFSIVFMDRTKDFRLMWDPYQLQYVCTAAYGSRGKAYCCVLVQRSICYRTTTPNESCRFEEKSTFQRKFFYCVFIASDSGECTIKHATNGFHLNFNTT